MVWSTIDGKTLGFDIEARERNQGTYYDCSTARWRLIFRDPSEGAVWDANESRCE
jgi:hypothetical protein